MDAGFLDWLGRRKHFKFHYLQFTNGAPGRTYQKEKFVKNLCAIQGILG
jgi:hypothetical protein